MNTCVNAKGQIVIPAGLRRKHGITKGTQFIVIDNGDSIILKKPVTEQDLENLQGSLKGSGAIKVLVDERNKEKHAEV